MNPQLEERIAQFRKMAADDPENELGHYRLGQLLLDARRPEEAAASLRRTLELSPQFSRVFQLLGQALIQMDKKDDAIRVLKDGYAIADERGDNVPRDEMAKLLTQLGQEAPTPRRRQAAPPAGAGGFRCQRPGCKAGAHARQLPAPPMSDDLGAQIHAGVCAECWSYWVTDLSIKVINEMRLDLSSEKHIEIYDQIMRETLGLT